MNFADIHFWFYLILGLSLIVAVRHLVPLRGRSRFDRVGLALLSSTLLFLVSLQTFLIFCAVVLGTYFSLGLVMRHARRRTPYLFLIVPFQLLPLFYYKYAHFAFVDVFALDFSSLEHLIIPVGLSFYTFQAAAFVVDTLIRGLPLPRFLDYFNFVSFFPQIVAGPIERRDQLLPQMERFALVWDPGGIDKGVSWIVLGLFFKLCIADNLANSMNPLLNVTDNPFTIWLCNLLFGLRIYYDFAGYSFIALGLARCFGIRLTLNFRSPYLASDFQDFWRRWHVSLSNWFRDYLYIPIGGGRARFWAANIFIVFVVSGLWHGAGWNFLLWGALHGVFLVLVRLGLFRLPWASFKWLLTMGGVFFAWLAFYETRTGFLWLKLRTLTSPTLYSPTSARAMIGGLDGGAFFVMLCVLALSCAAMYLEWRSEGSDEDRAYARLRGNATAIILVVLTVLFAPTDDNGFIYFAF